MFTRHPAVQVSPRRFGKIPQQFVGDLPCLNQQILICADVGKAQHRNTALARAKQFAGAAQLQILLGDSETIAAFKNNLQSRTCQFGKRLLK